MKKKRSEKYEHELLYTTAYPFYLTKTYFKDAGRMLGIKDKDNVHLKTLEEIRKKLHVKKGIEEDVMRLRRKKKIKNGFYG